MQRICPSLLKLSPRLHHALAHNLPIVALQSTIISHGMPYPSNKHCALALQQSITNLGAVPATIAIFDGRIHVGLEEQEIELLANGREKVTKVSRRDMAVVLARGGMGAMTVSATMLAAYAAGIEVFVTGGVGGVHRGYQSSMDVSADLEELGRTPVSVVSAGVKSILDIARTLEYLQTKGVTVMSYGTQEFPAFFSRKSGLMAPYRIDSQLEAAQIIYKNRQLGLQSGCLVAVPNPNPAEGEEIQQAIKKAIKQADQQKVSGARITPFLLKRVNQLTQGRSLKANVSLINNNAEIGAGIAVQLAKLKQEGRQRAAKLFSMKGVNGHSSQKGLCTRNTGESVKGEKEGRRKFEPRGKLIAIGASAIDYLYKNTKGSKSHFSLVGKPQKTLGGVARNIADCSSKMGIPTTLVTCLGLDNDAQLIRQSCQNQSITLTPIYPPKNADYPGSTQTGKYIAMLDDEGNQLSGISNMQINQLLTFDNLYQHFFKKQQSLPQGSLEKIKRQDIIVVDPNIAEGELIKVVKYIAQNYGCMVVYQSKGAKTLRVLQGQAYRYLHLIKANQSQSRLLSQKLQTRNISLQSFAASIGSRLPQPHTSISPLRLLLTSGSQPLTLHPPIATLTPPTCTRIIKTTGAGDTLMGTYLSMLLYGCQVVQALEYGMKASKINMESEVGESMISGELRLGVLGIGGKQGQVV